MHNNVNPCSAPGWLGWEITRCVYFATLFRKVCGTGKRISRTAGALGLEARVQEHKAGSAVGLVPSQGTDAVSR